MFFFACKSAPHHFSTRRRTKTSGMNFIFAAELFNDAAMPAPPTPPPDAEDAIVVVAVAVVKATVAVVTVVGGVGVGVGTNCKRVGATVVSKLSLPLLLAPSEVRD